MERALDDPLDGDGMRPTPAAKVGNVDLKTPERIDYEAIAREVWG